MAKSVLLVDDEKDAAEALKTFFDMQGIPCWVATDGNEALRVLAEQKPDLVLLDVTLERGQISGFEVLQQSKKFFPSTKVIMVTGYHDESTHAKANALGADGYLEKPLTPERILEVLKKLTG